MADLPCRNQGGPTPRLRVETENRSAKEAEERLGDAGRLLLAFALDGDRDRQLLAAGDLLHRLDPEAPADPRPRRDGSREADAVEPVVEGQAVALDCRHRLLEEGHDEREG